MAAARVRDQSMTLLPGGVAATFERGAAPIGKTALAASDVHQDQRSRQINGEVKGDRDSASRPGRTLDPTNNAAGHLACLSLDSAKYWGPVQGEIRGTMHFRVGGPRRPPAAAVLALASSAS